MYEIIVIEQEETDEKLIFEVEVKEGGTKTVHEVTLDKTYYKSLNTETPPEKLVKKSFDFLLKRESKESILSEFDLRVISNYFPEFDSEISTF